MKQLIFRDDKKIKEVSLSFQNLEKQLQLLYNSLLKHEAAFDLKSLQNLINDFRNPEIQRANGSELGHEVFAKKFIENYLKDCILQKQESFAIGGAKLSKEKLKDFIELENTDEVIECIIPLIGSTHSQFYGHIDISNFEVSNNKIKIREGALDAMAERFSFYANGQNQIDAFKMIKSACENLNALFQFAKGKSIQFFKSAEFNPNLNIDLIEKNDSGFVPNYHAIQKIR